MLLYCHDCGGGCDCDDCDGLLQTIVDPKTEVMRAYRVQANTVGELQADG